MEQNKEDTLSTQENDRYRGASSRRSPPSGGGGMGTTVMMALMVAWLAGAGWFIVNQ